jgi:tripartite-type tricarboxylate transporter receptor subunit TctC
MNFISLVAFFISSCVLIPSLHAEDYPVKAVRLIVPFPAGGGTDSMGRIVGGKLSEQWGRQVIIDNRGGAQGSIGTAMGAKAAPDGYTLTLAHSGSLAINPHLYNNTGYDTLKDFAPISGGVTMPYICLAHPSVPATSMKGLAKLASARPGQLSFASTSAGPQLVGELFKLITHTQLLHVPYKGGAPAVIDLIAGQVSIMFGVPTPTVPHVKSGKLRALALLGSQRIEALPDVPTANEAGYPELGTVSEWYGFIAPAAIPSDLLNKLNASVVRVLHDPDAINRLRSIGQFPAPSSSAEFSRFIREEYERWGKVAKASGAKAE